MKLFCSLLLLLLYLAVTGRPSDAQLLQQEDDVYLPGNSVGDPGLQLTTTTDSIDATWDEVPGASYYDISWTPDGNGPNTVDGTSSGGTYTYTITGLVPCTIYTVTLQPGGNGTDFGGPFTSSTTTLPHDPDRVTTVTVATVVDQSSQLAVSWTKAGGAGNCAVTYRVTWTPASGGGSSQDTTGALSYTITGLAACTSYTVCVTASTNGGYYTNDRCSSGTTDVDTPGPVAMGPLVTLSESSLRVAWDRPLNFKCKILYYTVKWTVYDTLKSNTTTTTSYTITDLAACTSYTVTVAAATNKGLGEETSESGATDSIAPDPPKLLGAAMVVNESDKLSVSWRKPDDPGPLCPVTRYTVTWYLASTQELVDQTTNSDTTFTISDLEAWTSYTVYVAAATEQNFTYKYSPPSCTNATTDQDTPGPPSDTKIESHTGESLLVVWSPPEEPRGIITNYSVAWSPPDNGNGTEDTVDGSITQYNITRLKSCVNYTVTVTAATIKGYGKQFNIINTTDAAAPPSPPVTCKKVDSPRQLTVTWSPADTQCTVNRYKVDYTGDVLWSDDTRHDSKELQTTYADLGDLTPWTTYTVCVAAVVVNDIVGAWDCCSSTTLEDAPGKPAEINQTSSSTKTVTLTWAGPEEKNGVVTDYQLAWDGGLTNLTANTTTYTISNLHRKSQFNVSLKARTGAGWGDSISIPVTTLKGVSAGAVAGGVVGGLLLVSAAVAAVVYRRRLKGKDDSSKHTRRSAIPMPMMPAVVRASDGDIKKTDLRKYIRYLESDTERGLEEEFASIQQLSPHNEATTANRDYNRMKNRFKNIFPYDNARVNLSVLEKPGSDYINASYMKDIDQKQFFIAAQGPMPSTTADFWRMVWEQRVYVIVMLTNLLEKGRDKCAQYWPRVSEPFITAGKFTIRNHNEESRVNHAIRLLEVSLGNQKRLVKQYHFTGWPDFGAPDNVNYLLDFMAEVRRTMPTNGEHLLVHCSAGVGRTGTFITLWNLMDGVDSNRIGDVINIKQMVLDMRQYRPHMVQALDQYLYLFKCIATYIETPYKWTKEYAGVDPIYDNTCYQNDDPIYDNMD
ncbi:receptor-type tyrosine-protein phosphatase H-like isoform X5 [Procambarus clarkii]|uniref:receptor-type tyrosine-protein phosphatase H-like isoform X5 n=1 Tax=Procambarus clarkii TaxID=6728 RepID=UPI003744059A